MIRYYPSISKISIGVGDLSIDYLDDQLFLTSWRKRNTEAGGNEVIANFILTPVALELKGNLLFVRNGFDTLVFDIPPAIIDLFPPSLLALIRP